MVYILFLCLLACNVQAADDGWGGADMKIVYHSRLFSGFWEASFKGKDVPFEGTTLYQAASKHILQGYCFLPDIQEEESYNPELRQSGVREFICAKQSFMSTTLERCLEKVADVLDGKKYVPMHIRRNPFTGEVARKRFFPKGKTRKWSLVARDKVTNPSFSDRVYFVFRDEVDALVGELCPKETSLAQERSLLYFEEAGVDYSPLQPTIAWESVPSPEELLQPSCGSKYNVGIIYFAKENEPSAALVNASPFTAMFSYEWSGTRCAEGKRIFTTLKTGMLAGYFLKRKGFWKKSKSKAIKDIAVLGKPHVRKCACDSSQFSNLFLDDAIEAIAPWLGNANLTLQGDDFWCGLKEEHCKMRTASYKQQWSIISSKELQAQLEGGVRKETVFLILRGEEVALKGRRIPLGNNANFRCVNSLFDGFRCVNSLFDDFRCVNSLSDGFRCVNSLFDGLRGVNSLFDDLSKQKVRQFRKEQKA